MKTFAQWVGSLLVLALGGAMVLSGWHAPAEADLTYVEGVPQDVAFPSGGEVTYVVRFTIDGYRIDYPERHGSYYAVRKAVLSGQPLRAGLARPMGRTVSRDKISDLYTLTSGDETVLSREQAVQEEWDGAKGPVLRVGIVLLCLGTLFTFLCFRRTRQQRST